MQADTTQLVEGFKRATVAINRLTHQVTELEQQRFIKMLKRSPVPSNVSRHVYKADGTWT